MSKGDVVQMLREFRLNGAPGIVIHDFQDGSGLGLLATQPIAAGQTVLSLPSASFLTVQSALRNSTLKKPLAQYGKHDFNENDSILALYLMLLRNQARGKQTQYSAYFENAPKAFNNTVNFSEEDVGFLQGSNVDVLARRWRDQLPRDYKLLFSEHLFQNYPSTFKSHEYSYDDFKWAISFICTRAFDISMGGQTVRAIMPGIDFLNHSFDAQCSHSYNDKAGCMNVVANRQINAGEQIFTNYGPIGNGRLVLVYGFATEVNPYTSVQIWATMDPKAKYYTRKQAILKKLKLNDKEPFLLFANGNLPEGLITTLYIQRCEEAKLLEDLEKQLAASETSITIQYEAKLRLELLSAVRDALQSKLQICDLMLGCSFVAGISPKSIPNNATISAQLLAPRHTNSCIPLPFK
eukprot:TRINITY_DN3522_c0_g1_i2.p1 TRINITY_DN3522_c0_g1~~TRINITY_DN3522_c0_g1_i2.p1  ORF type:complete len:408 (+),score=62.49 TRINITY_DN3522_c0_g1_i2:62-1285(+)